MTERLQKIIDESLWVTFSDEDIELFKRAELVSEVFNDSPYRTYKRLDKFNDHIESLKSTIQSLEPYIEEPIQLKTIPIHPERFKKYVRSQVKDIETYKKYYGDKTARAVDDNEIKVQEEESRYDDPEYYLSEEELDEYFSQIKNK